VRAPSQRQLLGGLFLFLALGFAWLAGAAADAGVWVISLAGVVLAVWLGSLAVRALARR